MLDGNELRALIRDVIATEIAAVKREHAPGTPAPAQSMQDFIDSIRTPRGGVRMVGGEAALD